jgi:hypothetical protein
MSTQLKKIPSNLWVVRVGFISFQEISYAGKPQVVSRYILSTLCLQSQEMVLILSFGSLFWPKLWPIFFYESNGSPSKNEIINYLAFSTKSLVWYKTLAATTFSIMTLNIMTVSIKTCAISLNGLITTISIRTHST